VHDGPRVLVAQRALPVGTIITADVLKFQEWPDELVQDAYFIDGEADLNALLGTVVRYSITAGEPVTQGALVRPGDSGFLAAALGPGMRAITVPVSDKTGVAGFIFPGDRVDLVLTQTVEGDGRPLRTAETILRNLRVLATDQNTTQEVAEDGTTVVRTARVVTLEVTPKIAEKVAVAETIGTLSLSLRSIADNSAELERAIASGSVVIPDNATPEQEERLLAAAAARPVDSRGTLTTGGDVSRFQRRTPPPERAAGGAGGGDGGGRVATEGNVTRSAEQVPDGPVVRVSRGNTVTPARVAR
jgi:pilus assembly protein CpaB